MPGFLPLGVQFGCEYRAPRLPSPASRCLRPIRLLRSAPHTLYLSTASGPHASLPSSTCREAPNAVLLRLGPHWKVWSSTSQYRACKTVSCLYPGFLSTFFSPHKARSVRPTGQIMPADSCNQLFACLPLCSRRPHLQISSAKAPSGLYVAFDRDLFPGGPCLGGRRACRAKRSGTNKLLAVQKIPPSATAPAFKLSLPHQIVHTHLSHLVGVNFELATSTTSGEVWPASITPRRNKNRSEYTLKVRFLQAQLLLST